MSILLVVISRLVTISSAGALWGAAKEKPIEDNTWVIGFRSIQEVINKSSFEVTRQGQGGPGIDHSEAGVKVCGIMGAPGTKKRYLAKKLFRPSGDKIFTSYIGGGLVFTYSDTGSWLAILMDHVPASVIAPGEESEISEESRIRDRGQTDAFLWQLLIELSDVVIITTSEYNLFEQAHIQQLHTIVDRGNKDVALIVAHSLEIDGKAKNCKEHVAKDCAKLKDYLIHGEASANLEGLKDRFTQKDGDLEIAHYCYAKSEEQCGKPEVMHDIYKKLEVQVRLTRKFKFTDELRIRTKELLRGYLTTDNEEAAPPDLEFHVSETNHSHYVFRVEAPERMSLRPQSATNVRGYFGIGSENIILDPRILDSTIVTRRGREKLQIEIDTVGIEPENIEIITSNGLYFLRTRAYTNTSGIVQVVLEKMHKDRDSTMLLPIQYPWTYDLDDPSAFRQDGLTGVSTITARKLTCGSQEDCA